MNSKEQKLIISFLKEISPSSGTLTTNHEKTMQTKNNTSKPETELKEETGEGCPEVTCYALRLFTYDYYEWEKVHAVSFDPKLLRAHFEGPDHLYANRPLVDGSEHSVYADREDAHWTIEPVNFLHNR